MKKIIFTFVFYGFIWCTLYSQVIFSSKIDSVLNLVSVQSIFRMNKELSGDTIVNIGSVPQILYSRYYESPEKFKAIQYLDEKFLSFGLTPKHMKNNDTVINVYVEKIGIKYPNKKFIISAHFDDIAISYPDTIHGADDNASGVCNVLEAARLLANMNLDYTVIFVAFDGEELGTVGSKGFADSCYFRGDTILGVLNVDMIGYHTDENSKATIFVNNNSMDLYNCIVECNQLYNTGFSFYSEYKGGSDHLSFWNRGYKAICSIEDEANNINPYFHSIDDRLSLFNIQYFYKYVKCNIATLMTLATDYYVTMLHSPLSSTYDTNSRIAKVFIKVPFAISAGNNAPRLYYKVNNGNYNYINAYNQIADTLKFIIPGKSSGSTISYYFALQDSAGIYCATLPIGGGGINPPGTTPPPSLFSYDIYSDYNQCSNTLPKPINDLQFTNDTILVSQSGKLVSKVKVNLTIYHPNDGDLIIILKGPNGTVNLSQGNGSSGSNYINTTFDDNATTSITQGTPPYTGSYRPQNSLSNFNNQPANGSWILRIYDSRAGNTGTFVNWCILLQLKNQVSVKEQNVPVKFELSQNYPNPFNPSTNIKYQIPKNSFVMLKIYDVLGREVAILVNEKLNAGEYEVIFNGNNLPSGVYFYKLTTGDFKETKKILMIK